MADEADARAALDVWWTDGSPWGPRWDEFEVPMMLAALNAASVDDAMEAFGITPGDRTMTSAAQDQRNRAGMERLRRRFGAPDG